MHGYWRRILSACIVNCDLEKVKQANYRPGVAQRVPQS
jgi:hypothetical protein